jgi:hypothetical protein
MKRKLLITLLSLSLLGCSSNHQIQNTKNIQKCIYNDNLAYDYFDSFKDSDTITRLPDGSYIHGTSEVKVNNETKYYDSDKDTGAIKAKKAKYLTLLYLDFRSEGILDDLEKYSDDTKVKFGKKGSYYTGKKIMVDNNTGEVTEHDADTDPDSIPVKEAKNKLLNRYVKEDSKQQKKNLSSENQLSNLLPETQFTSRMVVNEVKSYSIHYYGVSYNEYMDYLDQIKSSGFSDISAADAPDTNFIGKNDSNVTIKIHFNSDYQIISIDLTSK